MRERWARMLAFLTGGLVVLLSAAFAAVQNPPGGGGDGSAEQGGSTASVAVDAAVVERGRAVYDKSGCARCHSISGKGSPRSPLDGVAAKMGDDELHAWIVGGDSVADDLSPRALNTKKAYQQLPEADIKALMEYLRQTDGGAGE